MGLCKTSDPMRMAIFDPKVIISATDRGPLYEATYQISKTWVFWFQTRSFFKFSVKKSIFSSYDLDVQ